MDGSERQGAEEGKGEHGSSPNRRKHVKLNKFKGGALKQWIQPHLLIHLVSEA